MNIIVHIKAGRKLVIGPEQAGGNYSWTPETTDEALTVTKIVENNNPPFFVGPFDLFFEVQSQIPGVYSLDFVQKGIWEPVTGETYNFIIVVE